MSIAKELIKQHKKLDVEIKRLTKTRLNDRTSSSWKSLKELKKRNYNLKIRLLNYLKIPQTTHICDIIAIDNHSH